LAAADDLYEPEPRAAGGDSLGASADDAAPWRQRLAVSTVLAASASV